MLLTDRKCEVSTKMEGGCPIRPFFLRKLGANAKLALTVTQPI